MGSIQQSTNTLRQDYVVKIRKTYHYWISNGNRVNIVKDVPDTFSGCCKQKIGAPDLFSFKSSAKISVLIDVVVPGMQTCHPQDPQNHDY